MNTNFSILVNTCDKFEDCWEPFFKLFSIYWHDYKGKIYLNTEYKDFSYEGLDIVAVKGCEKHHIPQQKRATWSQCLKWALESIDTDIVLYMQEDYFLKDTVKTDWINYFLNEMENHPDIPCIQLTGCGIPSLYRSDYEYLNTSNPNYFSYLSCQAAFWRKDVMLSLVRDHESAWNFEWWGSKRAKYLGYKFLTVNSDWLKSEIHKIIPYIETGVIGGKWKNEVTGLFLQHDIIIDFSNRGFYDPNRKLSIANKIKVKKSIWKWRSVFEIIKLKMKAKNI